MNPNFNDEYGNVSEDNDKTDLWFMTKAIEMHVMIEQEEGQNLKSRQPIYLEYNDAEERLMRNYFGFYPKNTQSSSNEMHPYKPVQLSSESYQHSDGEFNLK
ncbi:hypothetical protein Tco_0216008 [Tanacetum coccineum]